MTLDELIVETRACTYSCEPLALLATAARQQQELADLREQLLDHFVQEARTAGCSWSQIGTALGVSKQAAQQRHSAVRSLADKFARGVESLSGATFKRFTARARQSIVLAQEEARRLRHDHLGTEHLLLGLLAEGEGVAAQALRGVGITLDAARAGVEQITGRGQESRQGRIPFAAPAKKALELALCEALELGHNYIGTEHLLLGLLEEGAGTGVKAIVAAGVQPDQLREAVLVLLETAQQ
ncbi:MAG: hypothetical protein JO287_04740 [Pseudonocardiales bacterium]|nr:hypothetical protein [Pseudonocardiales bacterium]